ncbi:MAG: DUF3786 domain-containing protein [Deltaproteobacteria bacterium]|nr:DUF3786 domain-containing protein [Deltaproteobacteria bacterium]
MAYKVLDILKDLPRTNCRDCGKGGCFAFASVVYLEGFPLSACPHLGPELLAAMEAKLEEGRSQGEGRRPEASEQALRALLAKIQEVDFAELARRSGARHVPGSTEAIEVPFLGAAHRVTRADVTALEGEAPSVWVKIFILIYLTRSAESPPSGEWAAYRELPNTSSKSKTYERTVDRLAPAYEGRVDELERVVLAMGGKPASFGSAERAWVFSALPKVDLLLLFWDKQEDFDARVSLLVDRKILDYLDQEAIVFLCEAFTNRLLGKGLAEIIP